MKEENFNLILASQRSHMALTALLTKSFEMLQRQAYLPSKHSDNEFTRTTERTHIDLVDEGFVRWIGVEGVNFN